MLSTLTAQLKEADKTLTSCLGHQGSTEVVLDRDGRFIQRPPDYQSGFASVNANHPTEGRDFIFDSNSTEEPRSAVILFQPSGTCDSACGSLVGWVSDPPHDDARTITRALHHNSCGCSNEKEQS